MTRLTDEELAEAMEIAQSMHSLRLTAALTELRTLRLTDEERAGVQWAHDCIVRVMQRDGVDLGQPGFAKTKRALAVLARLVGEK